MTLSPSCVKSQLEAACQVDQASCSVTSLSVVDLSGGSFDISFTTDAYFSQSRIATVTFPTTNPCWEQLVLRSWSCATSADCPASAVCVNGYCDVSSTTAECQSTADCVDNLVCRNGACVECGPMCPGSKLSLF